ncbi:unnamed protein product [Hydatigera taeniaeformis]|uniref:Alpha/beta hydrolase domain-containing protein 13 n=1 Tax=Hydatigena taeniaeformis TaxID=6205 RepID=A0A0R3WUV0_HYDTA|nr:unnamed protein product [Hydatigera taeniaeformis]
MSLFDKVFRRTVACDFFTKGWGRPDLLLQLIDNMTLVRKDPDYMRYNLTYRPIMIEKRIEYKKLIELEGSFVSPMEDLIPDAMCTRNRISRFQMIIPKKWKSDHRPVCLHFAGTGDHFYYRRRVFLANQLIDDGIASVIIMNPFYGTRLPVDQKYKGLFFTGSGLNYLSDLFVMGGALILECHTILRWCQNQGYGPFALHGISMGGYVGLILYSFRLCFILHLLRPFLYCCRWQLFVQQRFPFLSPSFHAFLGPPHQLCSLRLVLSLFCVIWFASFLVSESSVSLVSPMFIMTRVWHVLTFMLRRAIALQQQCVKASVDRFRFSVPI